MVVNVRRTCICVAVLMFLPCRQALMLEAGVEPASAPAASTFDSRRQRCFDAVLQLCQANPREFSGGNAFFAAEAMFESGHLNEARQLVSIGLNKIEPIDANRWIYGGNSGFTAWPGIDCYIRFSRLFDDALLQRFSRIYTGAVFYRRLSTSNHTLMASVTRYLATQVWGEGAFKADPYYVAKQRGDDKLGTFFSASDPTGVAFVRLRIHDAVFNGPGEYASRPYGAEDILPFLTLAECAKDSQISRSARIAYEICIAQLAAAYLHGHLATFSTRSYPDMLTQQPWGVAALLWIYFGGEAPADPARQWSLRAVTSDYRLPSVILPAGTDRTKPYVFRSLMNGWALYHYVNRSYVLFSCSPKAAHPKLLEQNYPCGVMWDQPDPEKGSHLWICNPAADSTEPGNQTAKIHTHGLTAAEQQVQYKNTSLSVFDIPANFRNPYVLGFVPGGYLAEINDSKTSDRIYLHYGSVLIAIASSSPFDWNPNSGIRAPAGKPHAGDSEFRVMTTQAALSLETASPDEFPGATPRAQLESFRRSILSHSQIRLGMSSRVPPQIQGACTDRNGQTLSCTFDGDDGVNGQTVDYKNWPTLESPWMHQPRGGDLTISDGTATRRYDLQNFTVSDHAP
jgi:hypothetical protein